LTRVKGLKKERDSIYFATTITSNQANSTESVVSLPTIEYEQGTTHTIPVYTRQAQINEKPCVQSHLGQTHKHQSADITTENENDEILTCFIGIIHSQ